MPGPSLPSELQAQYGEQLGNATSALPPDPVMDPRKPLCRHFQAGYCKKGRNCRFSHIVRGVWPSSNGEADEDCESARVARMLQEVVAWIRQGHSPSMRMYGRW